MRFLRAQTLQTIERRAWLVLMALAIGLGVTTLIIADTGAEPTAENILFGDWDITLPDVAPDLSGVVDAVHPHELVATHGRGLTPPPQPASDLVETNLAGVVPESSRLRYAGFGESLQTAIVMHHSNTRTFTRATELMERFGFAVHFAIDVDGRIHQLMDSIEQRGRAARSLDAAAIHILFVGRSEDELLANPFQLDSARRLVQELSDRLEIRRSNQYLESMQGIFSHAQVKKRFGGVVEWDPMDPGETLMRRLLTSLDGGAYIDEYDWEGRCTGRWVFPKRGCRAGIPRGPAIPGSGERKGRSYTDAPEPDLPIFETDSDGKIAADGRMHYRDRGIMDVQGVVLHFTATSTMETAIRVLEGRNLGAQILLDTDGKVYQAYDSLDHMAAAAAGTNHHCIQVEIIARGEYDLLRNEAQLRSTIELVKQLAEKYDFPINNFDIESGQGVFSHGQAKKRWGRSVWLIGSNFDPGEAFMKAVIEGAGGTYYHDQPVTLYDNRAQQVLSRAVMEDPFMLVLSGAYERAIRPEQRPLWRDRYSSRWVFSPYPWTP